ncbi:MAG: hypothetical protein P1V97_39245 [Planctomycetota bacterium]|nr:hypothetical protein [Planctomycetota bacterium]
MKQAPLNLFEELRHRILEIFDKAERVGATIAVFGSFGVVLLSLAALLDFPLRHHVGITGLAFIVLNFGLVAIAGMNVHRRTRLLLEDQSFGRDIEGTVASLTTLTISLQRMSLSLFRMMDRNSESILHNLDAFSFIPGINQLGSMGPEQVKKVSSLLIEVTEGWNEVFESIQENMGKGDWSKLDHHRSFIAYLNSILLPVNTIFLELDGQISGLINEPNQDARARHVDRILELLQSLHSILRQLPRSPLSSDSHDFSGSSV